jgi:hypothetical protein
MGRAVGQRLFVAGDLCAVGRDLGFVSIQVGLDPAQHGQRPHVIRSPLQVLLLVAQVLAVVVKTLTGQWGVAHREAPCVVEERGRR